MIEIFDDYSKILSVAKSFKDKLKKYYKEVEENEIGGCKIFTAKNDNTKMHLILQSGLHGIEGYVGFALINYFLNFLIEKFNSNRKFDLSLIINANPYGVENKRRVNENNVDLNRNFLLNEDDFSKIEDKYNLVDWVINPQKKVRNFYLSYIEAFFNVLKLVAKIGASKFKKVLLAGQKRNKKGAYYMGLNYQAETKNLMNIYEMLFKHKEEDKTIFIDLHTGYGKRYNMSIVNSSLMKNKEISDKIKKEYNNIVESNTDSFYTMNGDLIDFIYKKYPKIFYATAFEFGTFGDSILAGLNSVIAIILENQFFFYNLNGQKNEKNQVINKTGKKVLQFYEQAYFPKQIKWWEKAVKDFEDAISSIIKL